MDNMYDYIIDHLNGWPGDIVVRRHGNGFLQVPLDNGERIHIWDLTMPPAQSVNTNIHDHRWGFRSKVLRGRLRNHMYSPSPVHRDAPGAGWRIWEVDQGDEQLQRTDKIVDLYYASSKDIAEGATYSMPAFKFHSSEPLDVVVITHFVRGVPGSARARVLCPAGQKPDNAFDWHANQEELRYHATQAIASLQK